MSPRADDDDMAGSLLTMRAVTDWWATKGDLLEGALCELSSCSNAVVEQNLTEATIADRRPPKLV